MVIGSLPYDQAIETARWLALLSLGGVLARPLTLCILPDDAMRGAPGWIMARILGWLVVGWVPWLLAGFHILPFAAASWSGILALAVSAHALGPMRWEWRGFAAVEAGFLGLFWLGLAMRLGMADLSGLEKFTDMGFLAAAMRAEYMPPEDAWFAGAAVNYYYVGHAMVAAWGLLTGVPAQHAYQLAMATLFALTGLGSFALVARLSAGQGRRMAAVLGGLAALLVLYGGNFHSALYTLLRRWMPTGKAEFYYPDSTRFIGFDPETADKGFTEFPSYGFAVGDLHAHVIALPLFLLGVALILALLGQVGRSSGPRAGSAAALGWVMGVAATVNSWDVVCLAVLALVAASVGLSRRRGGFWAGGDATGAAMVIAAAIAALTAAPFLAAFEPFAQGLAMTPARTPLWQLLAIYGHVLPALGLLAAIALWRGMPGSGTAGLGVLAVSALILIAIPEEVFVRDIYGADFARANTMFKLSFRAQNLLLLAAVAALGPISALGRRGLIAAVLVAAPLIATLAYAPHIFKPPSVIRTLDGWGFLQEERALVAAAAALPLAPGDAIIEASGESFTEVARISAMTGLPTVIGWTGHQWLWRSGPEPATTRAAEVERFYTTATATQRCETIRRYGLRYAILGRVEAQRYPGLDPDGIAALGHPVHSGPGGRIIALNRAACAP